MKILEKQKAIQLRTKGYSLNEIRDKIDASKSTISLWVRDISLSKNALARIEGRMTKGQIAARKAKRAQTAQREQYATQVARQVLQKTILNKNSAIILCAMIYYCEGRKSVQQGIAFTNSDPDLIKLFLVLFRKSFVLDEEKFRVCVHLHSYHNSEQQLKFWSKTTTIPLRQFIKPYQKPHSGLYKKEGYQGCIRVGYSDVKIARELKAIAVEFMKKGLSVNW